jgi:predicted CDP-diglyceride synthetase/phosphatidate cytidylyltransferase
MSWIAFAIVGALGAIISDMLGDGYLELPKVSNGKFYPGFIGGIIIGATVGYLIDKSLLIAFSMGYIGKEAIDFIVKGAISRFQLK